MAFIFMNMSETIGIIMGNMTTTTTGSMFVSLLMVVIFIMAIATLFGIKLEYTAVLIMPLLFAYMSYYSEFVAIGSVIIIYVSFLFSKNFIFR